MQPVSESDGYGYVSVEKIQNTNKIQNIKKYKKIQIKYKIQKKDAGRVMVMVMSVLAMAKEKV